MNSICNGGAIIRRALIMIVIPGLAAAHMDCAKLKNLKVTGATVLSAEVIAAGEASTNGVQPAIHQHYPAYCLVKVEATPSADSRIAVEVWMPHSAWSGDYVQLGNGGLAGSINYAGMYAQIARGFAVAATDDGHTGAATDGSWAMGHPQKVIDFGYRAVHITSEISKRVVSEFYGRDARFAYFSGCSEGGREALMEAQRYPEDFNGILVGAPGHAWMSLMAGFAWNAQALANDPAGYIPPSKLQLIETAALQACGAQDGFADPFIKHPRACHFHPEHLLCTAADRESCLTAPQLAALQKIYAGASSTRAGKKLSLGYEPGAEAEQGPPGISYSSYIYGQGPQATLDLLFSSNFYGNFVFQREKYSSLNFDFDEDAERADNVVGNIMDATNPDLRAFKAHGGKMLHYHGWNDGSPPPLSSVDYYRNVVAKMGGAKQTQEFYRLYMVPGMMHCGLGPGPNSFGNPLDQSNAFDPEHNIFSALQQWVETGRAPKRIIATKYTNDDPEKPIVMTRPLCAYPAEAKWNGQGSTNEASNFSCQVPGKGLVN
jgi:feruloyl esterase